MHAFLCIIDNGFKPNETTIDDFNAGVPLSFSNGDCHIDVSRELDTYEYGTRPGIRLMNELEEYEISFSVNTPTDVVRIAIAQLHNDTEA